MTERTLDSEPQLGAAGGRGRVAGRRGRARPSRHAKPRVCVLLPVHWSAIMGGSQYQAKLLIERLLERYDVDVHYLTVDCEPDHRPDGYALHRFSSRDGVRRHGYFFDALRLYRALRALRPDVVYQQVGCAHTGIAAWYASRNGVPMVWRVSSDRSVTPERIPWWRLHRRIERAFLEYGIRKADVILAQTKAQQSRLAAHYGRADAEVVPNFHPGAPPPQRGRRRGSVVWIANLKPLKNPHAFVRLAAAFGADAPVRFVMIGAAMRNDAWTRDLLRAIDAVPNLEYLGARTQDEVGEVLADARVLVNTSDYEGFSNTFIQAWMLEVPVVSLRVDPDGVLRDQHLGFLSGTEDRLRRDVRRLVEDEELSIEIGRRCREHALRHHSMRNADRIAALLGLPPKPLVGSEVDGPAGPDPNEPKRPRAPAAAMPRPFAHAPDAPLRQ
ncbi:MAG TPA: glycosyltransferase family 4 protein [Gammaproteobacteria bacterium]